MPDWYWTLIGLVVGALGIVAATGRGDKMGSLKARTVAHQEVDYFDLDAFVKEITGRDWEFIAAMECSNDSDHSFVVRTRLGEHDQRRIDSFLAGDRGAYPSPHQMLSWLASQGHILPGNYLVKVSW